jgi:hypothetical protein
MTVPDRLHELVERFEREHAAYSSGEYNEAQVRVESYWVGSEAISNASGVNRFCAIRSTRRLKQTAVSATGVL